LSDREKVVKELNLVAGSREKKAEMNLVFALQSSVNLPSGSLFTPLEKNCPSTNKYSKEA
jgi:hypothetical protein